MTVLLQTRGLGKSYGAKVALDTLDLRVDAGEMVGLLGPNGAGKTTAISMIAGVLTPSRGTATIDGHDVRADPYPARRALGLVPQDIALYEELSARQNLAFFGALWGLRGRELHARIDWALDLAGLVDRAREPISRYSGGMKRRLNDATAGKLVAAVDASGVFRTRAEQSTVDLRARVAGDDGRIGLIIPAGFDPAAGRPAELVIDASAPAQFRAPIQGALEGILRRAHFGPPPGGDAPVLVVTSPEGTPEPLQPSSGFQVSVPGNAVLFGFFIALTVAISFVDEKKTGTWRRLLAAPVSRPMLLLAKLVPFYVVSLIQMAILFGIGALAFGMEVRGSPLALAAMTMAVSFCAVALGLFIASFGGSQKQVGSVGSISLLVMGLVGGAMVPRLIMPEGLQAIGLATPHAWALEGYYQVLMREGTGIFGIDQAIVMVLAFGIGFAAIGAWRFKFER